MSRAMGCWRGRSYRLPQDLAFTPEFLLLRGGSAAGVGPSQHQPGPAVPRARPRRMVLKALFMVPAVSDLSFVNGWQPGSVLSPCYVGQSEDRLCEPRSPCLDLRCCWMTQLRPFRQRPGHPEDRAGPWWTSPWRWCCGTAVCTGRGRSPLWSDIERWDGGNGRLLIEGSAADQIGLGEAVFITR